jgi:hypothetical protein
MIRIHLFPRCLLASLVLCAGTTASAQTVGHPHLNHLKHMAVTADAQRQAEVAKRGTAVMPFSLQATQHIFTQQADGGTQRVVARQMQDTAQVALVRQHLQDIRAQFLQGDFSGPAHIHGQDMPGLAGLRAAKPGQIRIRYTAVPGGAELHYQTAPAPLVQALHRWFDAQLADHGPDAVPGHGSHSKHHPGSHQH